MEQRLSKKVMILTGAGQIGMAIGPAVGTVGDPEIMEEDDEPFPSLD